MKVPLVHTGVAQRNIGRQWTSGKKEWASRIYTATPLTGSVRFEEQQLREQNAAHKQAFARLHNNPIGREDQEWRMRGLVQWQELFTRAPPFLRHLRLLNTPFSRAPVVVLIPTTTFFALKYQENGKFHNLFAFDTFPDTLPQKW